MKSKKFIFLTVKIQNGEYEYYSSSLHKIGESKDKNQFAEKHAKTFYSNFSHEDDGTYYFNAGEVATQLYEVKEITENEYNVLSKFI